jgi:hypothetical protein
MTEPDMTEPVVEYLDVSDLVEQELPHKDIHCPNLGGWVKVRGLSREEVLDMRSEGKPEKIGKGRTTKGKTKGKGQTKLFERQMIAAGMVRPTMTEAQVAQWQKKAAGGSEVMTVSDTIAKLSGMFDDAAKEAYREQAEDSAEEFSVLPST